MIYRVQQSTDFICFIVSSLKKSSEHSADLGIRCVIFLFAKNSLRINTQWRYNTPIKKAEMSFTFLLIVFVFSIRQLQFFFGTLLHTIQMLSLIRLEYLIHLHIFHKTLQTYYSKFYFL